MPFISESLDDVQEQTPAAEGEYDVRILKAEAKESKKGDPMIVLTFVFNDRSVEAPPFNHWLMAWSGGTPDEQVNMRKIEIKRFCAAFDLPEDFDPEDCLGQEATLFVTQEVGDDDVVRNRARFPRLK